MLEQPLFSKLGKKGCGDLRDIPVGAGDVGGGYLVPSVVGHLRLNSHSNSCASNQFLSPPLLFPPLSSYPLLPATWEMG